MPVTVSFTVLVLSELGPNHHVEDSGFHHAMHIDVQNRQHFRRDGERHGALLARLQRNALESLQLHYRLRHRSHALMDVELRNFIALARAGVRYVDTDLCRSRLHDLLRFNLQVVELERGVAEAVAKRKQRLPR